MVLTRRQHKAISRWLPNEIIAEIIQVAPTADRAALCRASKLFHGVGVPVLYRVVNVRRESTDAFSRTILANRLLAGLVRSLSVTDDEMSDIDLIAQMLASFRKLLHLEQLSIRIAVWEEHRDTFLRCSFPHLLSCHLGLATIGEGGIFPLVTSFLERHPSLRTFSTPLKAFSRDGADPLIPFSLPHLQNFRGPATLVPVISGTQDLREVRLSWFRQHSAQDIEEIARTLKSMTREDFPFICSNYDCDNSFIEVLESISRNLPHTNTLEMRGYGFNVSNEIKLSHLKNCLPRFTGLRVLSLAMAVDDDDPASREEATRRMTRDLGDICPSLEACRLNTYAWRKVNAMWEQYPADDFPELASISFPEVLH